MNQAPIADRWVSSKNLNPSRQYPSKAFQKFFTMIFIMSKKNYDFFSIIKFMSSSHFPQQGVHSNSASISRHLVTPASITAATSRSLIPLQLQTNIVELAIFQD